MIKIKRKLNSVRRKHSLGPAPLTMRDFRHICKAEGIDVATAASGVSCIFYIDKRAFILLGNQLRGHRRRHAAFHELGHYFMQHRTTLAQYRDGGRSPQNEIEADAFADAAIKRPCIQR